MTITVSGPSFFSGHSAVSVPSVPGVPSVPSVPGVLSAKVRSRLVLDSAHATR